MSSTDHHSSSASPAGAVPPWADVFDDTTTARHFVAVVGDVVEQRWGGEASFDPAAGTATRADGCMVSFANTACELVGFDETYWRSYLFLMLSEYDSLDLKALDAELRSWTNVRSRLRIRLYPTTTPSTSDNDWNLIDRPLSASLRFVLAADADIGSVPIAAEAAAEWGKPIEQAWRTAIKNTRSRVRVGTAVVRTPTAQFFMLDGGLFTTGHARDLSSVLPGMIGDHGALLTAPTSRTLFVQPIDDPASVRTDAVELIVSTMTFQALEPNPLGRDVLWYRGADDLVGALDVGPGIRIRPSAPEPMASWLGSD